VTEKTRSGCAYGLCYRACLVTLLTIIFSKDLSAANDLAQAQDGSPTISKESSYETELIATALTSKGLVRVDNPANRLVSEIQTFREPVVSKRDPLPRFLNALHVQTRQHIIEREILLRPGMPYSEAKRAESERNLRKYLVLASARIIVAEPISQATQHTNNNRDMNSDRGLTLLVVSKDLWSLRVNMDFSSSGTLFSKLYLEPTEANLLGLNKHLSAAVTLRQFDVSDFSLSDAVAADLEYLDPRVWGTRIEARIKAEISFNGTVPCVMLTSGNWCTDENAGSINGHFVYANIERRFFALSTRWGFRMRAWTSQSKKRRFVQDASNKASLDTAVYIDQNGSEIALPYIYDNTDQTVSAEIRHADGTGIKHDLSLGFNIYNTQSTLPNDFPAVSSDIESWFRRNILPRSERIAAITGSYSSRRNRFLRATNLHAFGISEDYPIGPYWGQYFSLGLNLDDTDQSFISSSSFAGLRYSIGKHIVDGFVAIQGRLFESEIVNRFLRTDLAYMSPMLHGIRFLVFSQLAIRVKSQDRTNIVIGGGGRSTTYGSRANEWDLLRYSAPIAVRGFAVGAFEAPSTWQTHGELRSRPWRIKSIHFGGVLFYDGVGFWGQVGPDTPIIPFAFKQSIGAGLRIGIPQFNRELIRIDVGLPLSDGPPSYVSASFGQVF